ncbi:hypothetical protein LZ30DRAFT_800141 [Colletotrichum cereale]|nr:hypothetical protein LZ30DRAFT_800141 [Colletotrichum cereale]
MAALPRSGGVEAHPPGIAHVGRDLLTNAQRHFSNPAAEHWELVGFDPTQTVKASSWEETRGRMVTAASTPPGGETRQTGVRPGLGFSKNPGIPQARIELPTGMHMGQLQRNWPGFGGLTKDHPPS